MRIVVNDIAASKTGALAILLDFYEYVKANGNDHEWIFLTGIDCLKETGNIKVILMDHVKRSQKDRLYFDLVNGSKFLEDLEPDVIFSLQNTLTRGAIRRKNDKIISEGNVWKKGEKVPQVLYVHQPLGFQKVKKFSFFNPEEREYAIYQYLIGALIDASVKRADKVIVQTAWMKDAVSEKTGVSKDKICKVLPDIADLSEYRPADIGATWNPGQYFFPSGEILYKNHECVIKAAQILNERGYTDFQVHFTLKGLSDVTKREYADPNHNIHWSGRISREEVLTSYAKSTLIFPSYIETFGIPLAEARQMGTMVLASDCPFCREVLAGYENVKFFDPFNEKELADLMEEILTGKLFPVGKTAENQASADIDCDGQGRQSYGEILKIIENSGKK